MMPKNIKYQRFVSLSSALSFIVILISSGVLYFIPDRGVTSWTNWKFLGLDKQQWDNLHINLGIFFLVMIIWHIYFNWKPIKNYLKIKKELKVFTKEFNYAFFWVVIFIVGTMSMTFPFSFLVNIGNGIKAINALDDGNPPFAYAQESRLNDFCLISNIDLEIALSKLQKNNIKIKSSKQTLKKLALQNNCSPKDIYNIIKINESRLRLPTSIPVGIAHKSLKRLSYEYILDMEKFIDYLKKSDIEANENITFKKLAKLNNLHPANLYNMLLASQIK